LALLLFSFNRTPPEGVAHVIFHHVAMPFFAVGNPKKTAECGRSLFNIKHDVCPDKSICPLFYDGRIPFLTPRRIAVITGARRFF